MFTLKLQQMFEKKNTIMIELLLIEMWKKNCPV